MKEVWKDIEGYEGMYKVSSLGNVMSMSYRNTGVPKLLKLHPNSKGYLRADLFGKKCFVSILVAKAFISIPKKLEGKKLDVCHRDDNFLNNKVDNLFWDTRKGNLEDMVSKGRSLRGEKNRLAILTDAQVQEVRNKKVWKYGDLTKMAKKFGVSIQCLSDIKQKRNWKHLEL